MAVIVKTAYGDDETHPAGVDWFIDRDRDLFVYDKAAVEAEYALAVYPNGQWCRVMRDGPAPAAP